MTPTFSIIVPVYNRPEELGRALASLQRQTDQDFEVIVCDDGSTEDVLAVCRDYPMLRLQSMRIENSGGPARPRNVALRHASGSWLAFLDSDDWWLPERLSVVRAALSNSLDFLYHPLHLRGPSGAVRRGGRKLVGANWRSVPLRHMAIYGNPIPNSAVIVRRSVFEGIGGFSEDPLLVAYEDFDAWLRLAEVGARMVFLPQALGFYWTSPDAISRVVSGHVARRSAIYDRHKRHFAGFAREAAACHQYELASLWLRVAGGERYAWEHLKHSAAVVGARRKLNRLFRMATLLARHPDLALE